MTWFRCPLALMHAEPGLTPWVHWAARYSGAFQAGGLSPYEMDERFSAVADEVFGLWSKGQSDALREARLKDGGPRSSQR